MESGINIATLRVLSTVYNSWDSGATGFECCENQVSKDSQWYSAYPRRLRLLAKNGYVEEVRALQGNNWRAYRLTMKGLSLWDRLVLQGVLSAPLSL